MHVDVINRLIGDSSKSASVVALTLASKFTLHMGWKGTGNEQDSDLPLRFVFTTDLSTASLFLLTASSMGTIINPGALSSSLEALQPNAGLRRINPQGILIINRSSLLFYLL